MSKSLDEHNDKEAEKPVENKEKPNTLISKKLADIHLQILETRKDIQSAVTPKFLDVSIQVKDLIELAIELWRLEIRMNTSLSSLPTNQKEILNNSIQKLKRYLEKNDIEILDHTNQKFNEGRNLDILAVDKDSTISEAIIKETKEPTIIHKGYVVHKGKVIVLSNAAADFSEAQK